MIERCTSGEDAGWLALRDGLWPQPRDLQLGEMAAIAAEPRRYAAFVAYGHDREPVGFAEAALRTDYVNGAQSSPVAFLEGLYVAPRARRRGIGRALVGEVCRWARALGCREVASDALVGNEASQAVHRALGFAETERVVFYRMPLGPA